MKTFQQLADMRGRVAVVTGGAGKIGSAMCDALSEVGATVVVVDRDGDACEAAVARASMKSGAAAIPLPADLSNEAETRAIAAEVARRTGRLDVLIHCAALVGTTPLQGWGVPFPDQSVDTWRQALEVNLTSAFVLTQACAPALAASGCGSIISVGSTYGLVGPDLRLYDGTPMGNPAAYAASKGGLLQFTRWLSTALAPRIRANAITPGGVWRNQPEAFTERYIFRTPLGRMAAEEDFKGAVVYLASDLSRYVTGHNLVVDGGWTAW